jgi:ABC-type sugar transport system permease subunit
MTAFGVPGHWSRTEARNRQLTIFGFLVVPLIMLTVLSIWPLIQMVWLSFHKWNGFGPKKFVGLQNYEDIFIYDTAILRPILNSLYYFGGGLLQLALALWFAVILSGRLRGSNVFRTVLFLPFVLNTVAAALVFRDFLRIDGGLDSLLAMIGLDGLIQQWVQDRDVVNWSLVAASMWRYLGFNVVITYGALMAIPQDQYEAADLEGASGWQKFRFITWPTIRPVIALQMLLSLVGSLEVFDIPFLITRGANDTTTFIMAILQMSFEFRRVGMACAMGVVMLVIVLTMAVLQRVLFGFGGKAP